MSGTMHEHATDAVRETAALYALGALPPEESRSFERHLEEGCAVCADEAIASLRATSALAELAADPVAPPPTLRDRLLARLAEEKAPDAGPDAGAGSAAAAAGAAPEEPPSPQVWKNWQPGPVDEFVLLRKNEGSWEETGVSGVTVRRLFIDSSRQTATMLVRMTPGSSYPPHRHAGPEECYVLEGDLRHGDLVMRAGDYQRGDRSSVHDVQWTEGGCLLLIVSSLDDELL